MFLFCKEVCLSSLGMQDSVVQSWCDDRINNPTYIEPSIAAKADLPGSICLLYGSQGGSQVRNMAPAVHTRKLMASGNPSPMHVV